MTIRHAVSITLLAWYLLIPPVFAPMGSHPRAFNDLNAPMDKWDIQKTFDTQADCVKQKDLLLAEAPRRIAFANQHPDQDPNGNILAVAQAWQLAQCVAADDPRLGTE